jgi:FlaA1/EpsC-like NDP-sugar epimerase
MGFNVLGTTRRIPDIVKDHGIATLILAMHNVQPAREKEIIDLCRNTGARVVKIPDIAFSLLNELKKENVAEPAEFKSAAGGVARNRFGAF